MVSNTQLLDDIALRKAQILQQGMQNLNNAVNNYNAQMKEEAKLQNKGALSSYNGYMPLATSATDRQMARSAYLNRLGSANDASLGAIGQMDANKNIYGAYLESAGNTAEANINNLAYNDYVKQAELAYQRERDKIKDAQADKEYKLDLSSYKRSRRGYGRYGSSRRGTSGDDNKWKNTLKELDKQGHRTVGYKPSLNYRHIKKNKDW